MELEARTGEPPKTLANWSTPPAKAPKLEAPTSSRWVQEAGPATLAMPVGQAESDVRSAADSMNATGAISQMLTKNEEGGDERGNRPAQP